jgi:hypothetical protein
VLCTIIKLIRYVLLLPPFLLVRSSLPPHGATSLATPLSSTRLAPQTTRLRLRHLNKPEVEGPAGFQPAGPVGAYCGTVARATYALGVKPFKYARRCAPCGGKGLI